MEKIDFQPMLKHFREYFPSSIPFGNSTGAGISIRSGPSIESELAIFNYIPAQDHFTLTITHRLVKNPSTNTRRNFEVLENMASDIEKKCLVKVKLICPYAKPLT